MMLLAAAAGVGIAQGKWEDYTPGTPGAIAWKYERIGTTNTCRIKPKDTATISGKVDIPNTVNSSLTVVEIAPLAFENCSGLTAVDIPNSVTTIGLGAFSGCKRMTAVKIPNGVKQIETIVFSKCSSLTEITIPSSVAMINASAFLGCSGLKNFKVDESNASYCAVAGVLFTKKKDKLICCPKGMEGEYVIPDGVTMIGGRAFADCKKLSAVTIPSSVKTISAYAFIGCSELTEVPIPSSVKTIQPFAFHGCKWLKEFKVEQGNERYDVADGVLFTKNRDTIVSYPGGRKGAFEVPYGVTAIGVSAFSGCDGLTGVTIPSSVTAIGVSAFASCSGLTAVTIPDGVTAIRESAFEVCENLKEVTIPSSVKTIDRCAFRQCSGLEAVTISGGETAIGTAAFFCCSGLNAVYWLVGSGEKVDNSAFERIGNSATLYVRKGKKTEIKDKPWCKGKFTNAVEGYVVTFQDGEGHTLGEQLVKPNNGTASESAAPTKKGFTIVEWQLDGKKYDFGKKVEKNITLVAVWKQNYTVTFDAKGGTPAPDAQEVVKDGTATAPTAPTKEGYTFVEWQLDGVKYVFSTPVTKDITLVAVWKKNEESTPSTPKDPETAVESVQLAGVRVLRNPVGEALELEGMERAARVEVYSVVGARVHAEALRGEPRVVIDAQGWASGVYVVRVVASDGERTLRVVK